MKLWNRWEVFNPVDGIPIYSVPFAFIAAIIVRFSNKLDYERTGKGW